MSCRNILNNNGFTTNIVTPSSSLLVSNVTPNSFFTLTTTRNIKKLRCSFKTYAAFLELPLLPFPSQQVMVPSETKTLHLFEARYLKLLDESLFKKKKLFVHFVLDPIVVASSSKEASFAARYACLVVIDKVEQLDVGALVTIRGIGRVTLVKFAKVFTQGGRIIITENMA